MRRSSATTPGGDKNQAAQLIKFKIYMTLLLEGKESRAQKMMEQFQFTGDTPALYYAQAAWEFKHNNPTKATDWITSAKKIYSPSLNVVFGDAFYDLGWMQSPGLAGSPAPATEAAAVMSAQAESSPAFEPTPIPGTTVAARKEVLALAGPAPTIAGMEATTSHALDAPAATTIEAPVIASSGSIAAGTPAKPEDIPAIAVPSLSPTVETTPAAAPTASVTISAGLTNEAEAPVVAKAKTTEETAGVASTPAVASTVLAPSRLPEAAGPTFGERLGRFLPDGRTLLVGGLIVAAISLLAWVIVPEVRRRLGSLPVYQRPIPATGPPMDNGNGGVSAQKVIPNRLVGGPRQVSLQLKASEPSLRRSVRPATKPNGRGFAVAPTLTPAPGVVEPVISRAPAPVIAPEPKIELPPLAEVGFESVGPVIEQGAEFAPAEEVAPTQEFAFAAAAPQTFDAPAPEVFDTPAPVEWDAPAAPIEPEPMQPLVESRAFEPVVEPEMEPVGQGQPVPYEMPVFSAETEAAPAQNLEVVEPAPMEVVPDSAWAGFSSMPEPVDSSAFAALVPSTEPPVLQSTIPETMPEPTQTQTSPVIRTPATGGTPQPSSAMQTAVQLTFSFEIASMQLTPTFKMGALQLRPTSKIVTMRLAPSQQPQPSMNLQVVFEIAKIQPSGGGLGTVRLSPSQQQRPNIVGSPSFTVGGLQLVSNFEAAPVQLTPSQQASVQVTGAFQIATVEFSPSFEIASIVLNSSAKQVAVQLPGAGSVEGAPRFEIANLQLGPSGEIGMMQLNLLGQGPGR